jgi:hypothetical protein
MRKAIVSSVMIAALAGATFGTSILPLAAATKSCSARMNMVKEAWQKMPEGAKKDEIASDYNDANHALKAHDMRGCLTNIEKAEAAIKSGP